VNVPDEGYFRNVSYALHLISTYFQNTNIVINQISPEPEQYMKLL